MGLRSGITLAGIFVVLAACSPSAPPAKKSAPQPLPKPSAASPQAPAGPAVGTLEWAARGPWRPAPDVARNRWRHPVKTLQFCGLKPGQSVIEVWPGAGWYTQILAPWLHRNDGHLRAVLVDPAISARAKELNERYIRAFSDESRFGHISTGILSATSPAMAPPASADLVLTFRNVHSWLASGMAKKAFAEFYAALKPGGSLCVVEHRLPDSRQQDPQAHSGYVQTALVKALAKEAGFVLDGQSEINANPKDNGDHPFGVWTLPPVRRSAARGETPAADFDRAKYDAIGESDRMTLRFVKPPAPTAKEPDDGT